MAYPCTDDPQEVLASIDDVVTNSAKLDLFVNGEDTDTVQLGAGDPTPALRNVVRQMLDLAEEAVEYDEDHPEFLRYYKDADGKFLWGIRIDGTIEWAAGVPKPVRDYISSDIGIKLEASPEFLLLIRDADGKFLFGVRRDGGIDWGTGVPKPVRSFIESFASVKKAAPIAAVRDASGTVLEETMPDGTKVFHGDVRVKGRLVADEDDSASDWSRASNLKIPIPECAKVNIIGFVRPTVKAVECKCWMEFWDMQGNYFKKPVIVGLQGDSTWNLPKPNYKFDLFADEWDGEEFEITFGDWVPQDSFHLKAFFTDIYKGRGIVIYKLYEEILMSRGATEDRAWKQAMLNPASMQPVTPLLGEEEDLRLRLDTGAKCHPDAFPCAVYLDGRFHGLFSFQLKKHRKNYHMVKDNPLHIHLDEAVPASLFGSVIDWTGFELRNPSGLYCMDGSEYDADTNRKELIDETSAHYGTGSSKVKKNKQNSKKVKDALKALSAKMASLVELDYSIRHESNPDTVASLTSQIKSLYQSVFDVRNVIDYTIIMDVDGDVDGVAKNCQWTTWDGQRWYLNLYDTNDAFGGNRAGGREPFSSHFSSRTTFPAVYVARYFADELHERYRLLRDSGILSTRHILAMLNRWVKAFGEENYELEEETWPSQSCWSNAVVNSRYWEAVLDSDGRPETAETATFSLLTEYEAGDFCSLGSYSVSASTGDISPLSGSVPFLFRCLSPCKGVVPYVKITAAESFFKMQNWLDLAFENMDTVYGYTAIGE